MVPKDTLIDRDPGKLFGVYETESLECQGRAIPPFKATLLKTGSLQTFKLGGCIFQYKSVMLRSLGGGLTVPRDIY